MSGYSPRQSARCSPVLFPESHISDLPTETLLQVFSYLRTADVISCVHTCQHWREVIEQSEALWKLQCLTLRESAQQITEDRVKGLTWKETFRQNYGSNGVKRLWRQGTFSNPSSYKDFPTNPFCILDADSWGEIFQEELQRP